MDLKVVNPVPLQVLALQNHVESLHCALPHMICFVFTILELHLEP